jgi:hypothetical protein
VLADKDAFTVWLHAAKRLFHVLTTFAVLVEQRDEVWMFCRVLPD